MTDQSKRPSWERHGLTCECRGCNGLPPLVRDEPTFCQQCVDKARELAGHQIRAEEFYAERQEALAEIDRYREALTKIAREPEAAGRSPRAIARQALGLSGYGGDYITNERRYPG